MALLEITDLSTHFFVRGRELKAVDRFSLSIEAGETVALVGESGCGKSVTAASILRLVPSPPGRIVGGSLLFEGQDLRTLSDRAMRQVRGNRIGMIFQEPMTALNPVFTIGHQITESLAEHRAISRSAARARAAELLELVRIPDPQRQLDEFPHRLSGGMRQRVMIAMALACEPRLLIADEPTTALDVTTQAQILSLLNELKQRLGMAILIITHDLGVVAQTAQRVAVMYAGRKIEEAPVADIFRRPLHPYTLGLLRSLARPDLDTEAAGRPPPLDEIPGLVPALDAMPPGCAFAPRCFGQIERCSAAPVPLEPHGGEPVRRAVACVRAGELT